MSNLIKIAANMARYMDHIDQNIGEAVMKVDYMLLDLNREQMKGRQVDAFDNSITPPYSPKWKQIKGLTYPNLYDMGDYQKKLILNTDGKQFEIHSRDWKDAKLRAKYGENITGIAPSNRQKAYGITNYAIGEDIKRSVLMR